MQQDDVALVQLTQNALDDVRGGHLIPSVRRAPIVGIDALADNQIAHILGGRKLGDFLGIFRLMIDAVRRAEENGLCADGALDEAFREVQLPLDFGLGDLIELRMGERVIADFVAVRVLAFEDFRMLVGFLTDHEKDRGGIFFLEDIENLGSPARIGTIIEREDYLLRRRAADLVNVVGERIVFVSFVDKQVGGRFVDETSAACFGSVGEMPDIAVTFECQVWSGRNILYFLTRGVIGARGVPDWPERGV